MNLVGRVLESDVFRFMPRHLNDLLPALVDL